MALNFNQYATEGNTFLKDYAKEMNMPHDRNKAGRIFTAIMHALRDIIPPEESLQLIAQLPMFLKAVYVNGWNIKKEKPMSSLPILLKPNRILLIGAGTVALQKAKVLLNNKIEFSVIAKDLCPYFEKLQVFFLKTMHQFEN